MYFPTTIVLTTLLTSTLISASPNFHHYQRATSSTTHCATNYGKSTTNQRAIASCCAQNHGRPSNNRARKLATCANLRGHNKDKFVQCVKAKQLNPRCAVDHAPMRQGSGSGYTPIASPSAAARVAATSSVASSAAAVATQAGSVRPIVPAPSVSVATQAPIPTSANIAASSTTPTADTPTTIAQVNNAAINTAATSDTAAIAPQSTSLPDLSASSGGVVLGDSTSTCQATYAGLSASNAASTLSSCCSSAGGQPTDATADGVLVCSGLSDAATASFGDCAGSVGATVSCVA